MIPLRRVGLIMMVLLAVALSTVRAAEPGSDEARLRRGLSPELAQQVLVIVRQARDAGVPADPLIARALEGASRGADALGIVASVRRQAAALTASREALGAESDPDELVAGASALMAGLATDSLRSIRVARPGQRLVIPLVVLCDLLARGVPPEAAASSVITAVRAGATDPTLLRIRERIHSRIEHGGRPARVADDIVRQWLMESPGRKGRATPRPTGAEVHR